MRKGELLEAVYLRVNGGQLSADTNVRREDINVMLAPAINYITLKETRIRKRENMGVSYTSSTGVDSEFLATFTLPVLNDDQRCKRYVEPSIRLNPLDSNRGIDTVAAIQGERQFQKLRGEYEDVGLQHVMPNVTRYWFEYIGVSQRIYFKNLPMSVQEVIVKAVARASDLEDDDEIPMAAGVEIEVLELLVSWFTGQKAMPDDYAADGRDADVINPK